MEQTQYYEKRCQKISGFLTDKKVDAFLITCLDNIRYLCGFPGTSAFFVVTPEKNYFLTDFRYQIVSAQYVKNAEIIIYKEAEKETAELLKKLKIKKLGVEGNRLNLSLYEKYKKSFKGLQLIGCSDIVEKARIIKDQLEIDLIKRAIAVSGKSFEEIIQEINGTISEKELAIKLKCSFLKNGADEVSFEPIILTGANSASPHAINGNDKLQDNSILLMDFGVSLEGYMSDTTRSVKIGNPSEKIKEIYTIVNEARLAAIESVKPEVSLKEIDLAARNLIAKAGYGDYFGHGTGHGVGVEIHEKPTVSFRSKEVAEEGMVFTIEPGIYLPEIGGVRLEDMILVTKDGCDILTKDIPHIEELDF